MSKVQFGLKNVHYSVLTEGDTNSWATPVAVAGAVNLSLDAEGESNTFYADNVAYFMSNSNNGYSGTLEMAKINDSMLKDVFGQTLDTNKGLAEYANVDPKPFALLFQIDGDAENEYYVFYRVVSGRPSITSETIGESKEPVTQTLNINCLPVVTGTSSQQGLVKYRTTAETTTSVKTAWFTTVQFPA